MYVLLMCVVALRWLREDIDIPDSSLYITLLDFEVFFSTISLPRILFRSFLFGFHFSLVLLQSEFRILKGVICKY